MAHSMELELGLGLSLPKRGLLDLNNAPKYHNGYCDEPRNHHKLATLPLFCTHRSGDDDDGDGDDGGEKCPCQRRPNTSTWQHDKNVVGWPPVKAWRRRQIAGEDEQEANEANCVKVKMEGAAIGRKVDLALHSSYHSLKTALFAMFRILDASSYSISYQDREGRWMILGDVSYGVFVQSVQKMVIQREAVRGRQIGM